MRVVASAERVPARSDAEPQVSGTATACRREMLSTIGSALCQASTDAASILLRVSLLLLQSVVSGVRSPVVTVWLTVCAIMTLSSAGVHVLVLEVVAIVDGGVAVMVSTVSTTCGLLVVSSSILLLLFSVLLLLATVTAVALVVVATMLSSLVLLLLSVCCTSESAVIGVVVASVVMATIGAGTAGAAAAEVVEVDQRPALAGVQLAWTSPALPQAPISYLRLVAVVA